MATFTCSCLCVISFNYKPHTQVADRNTKLKMSVWASLGLFWMVADASFHCNPSGSRASSPGPEQNRYKQRSTGNFLLSHNFQLPGQFIIFIICTNVSVGQKQVCMTVNPSMSRCKKHRMDKWPVKMTPPGSVQGIKTHDCEVGMCKWLQRLRTHQHILTEQYWLN